MPPTTSFTWANVPRPFRTMARWITVAQAAGYGVSLAFARHTAARFANPSVDQTQELLVSAHSHLLSMTALFALSGVSFALCSRPAEPLKTWVLSAPFAAILTGFTAVWLMRYSPLFSWALLASHLVMAVAFYFQIIVTLRELRRVRTVERAQG